MEKYGQTDKQKEIEELERKQAALLRTIPEKHIAAQRTLEEQKK